MRDELSLIYCDHKNTSAIDYTYKHEGIGYRRFIDHVFVSASINQSVSNLTVIENEANTPDHNAIVFTLYITESLHVHVAMDEEIQNLQNCHVCWSERNKELYYETTGVLLKPFEQMELSCARNSKCCNDIMHRDIVEQKCQGIVAVLQEAINTIMPAKFQGVSNEHKYNRYFQ